MWLPDSLADNMLGELLPFRIKQSCPKTRTISLCIAEEVRSGTLDKGFKVPVRHVHTACCPSQALDARRETSLWAVPTNAAQQIRTCWELTKRPAILRETKKQSGFHCSPSAWSVSRVWLFPYRNPATHCSSLDVAFSLAKCSVLVLKRGLTDGEIEREFQAGHFLWLLQGHAVMRRVF